MDKIIGWELYRSFLAVMQSGSLSAAARATGSTQPTLGRHIKTLEQQLGLVLFTRVQGGLIATDEAKALQPYAEQMASCAAALNRIATSTGDTIKGVVRITASDIVGIELLPATLSRLRGLHPQLQLELSLTDQVQDLLHRQADIAVRMFRPTQTQLIARKIGSIELGLYAAPDYLARCGIPISAEQLSQHALIGFDQVTDFIRQAAKTLPENSFERKQFAFSCDSNVAQLAMIRAGLGIGFCQSPVATRYQLTRLLPEQFAMQLPVWITMHEDLNNNRACRCVFSALGEMLEQPNRSA